MSSGCVNVRGQRGDCSQVCPMSRGSFAAVIMHTTMDREIIEGFVLSSKFCLPPHELSVVYHLVLWPVLTGGMYDYLSESSIQMNVICFIRLQLMFPLLVNVHHSLFWWFCLESASLSLFSLWGKHGSHCSGSFACNIIMFWLVDAAQVTDSREPIKCNIWSVISVACFVLCPVGVLGQPGMAMLGHLSL